MFVGPFRSTGEKRRNNGETLDMNDRESLGMAFEGTCVGNQPVYSAITVGVGANGRRRVKVQKVLCRNLSSILAA